MLNIEFNILKNVLHVLKLNYTFKIVYKKMHFFIATYLFQNQITAATWKVAGIK